MWQAAAAFGGGFMLQKQFEQVNWPQFHKVDEESRSFKLSVRVLSASIPALSSPGLWTRQRPRLEVTIGDNQKDTELADFAADDNTCQLDDECECPWRFGDTLKFALHFKDVADPGHVRLRLRAHSDVQLGPVQFQFSGIADLGEASVDLQRRALPACIGPQTSRVGIWESPVVLVPLFHVRGGLLGDGHVVGQAVAHIAVSFSVDVDPEEILAVVANEWRPVSEQVRSWMDQAPWSARTPSLPRRGPIDIDTGAEVMRKASRPSLAATERTPLSTRRKSEASRWEPRSPSAKDRAARPARRKEEQSGRSPAKSCAGSQAPTPQSCSFPRTQSLISPNLAPDGWIACRARNGRTFWHHKALGPPPWDAPEGSDENIPPERPNWQENTLPQFKALPVKLLKCAQDQDIEDSPNKAIDPMRPEAAKWNSPNSRVASSPMQPCHAQGGRASLHEFDLEPDGWVSCKGPNDRIFWHHLALGPAPWEEGGPPLCETAI
mmetsp:Transcript_13926/g.24359  ORF Transcript_13926/g.24359 Transcript_13926/m.24359 type:complete len:493 (+) Transcript_13926:154-1632(+)